MIKLFKLIPVVALVVSIGLHSSASAQTSEQISKDSYPREVTDRPLTLPTGMLEIAGTTVQMNLSEDLVGTPILVAPTISYGVTDDISASIAHSRGFCVNGETDVSGADVDLCGDKVYDDIALRALYNWRRAGAVELAASGGLSASSFDPLAMRLELGVLGRYRTGNIAMLAQPGVAIGLTERDADNEEQILVPVAVQWQLTDAVTPFVSTGLATPIDEAGDNWKVPFGLGVGYAVSNTLDVGGELTFPAIAGGAELMEGVSRMDERILALRLAWRN